MLQYYPEVISQEYIMGQSQMKSSKNQNNASNLIELPPVALMILGTLIENQKFQKINDNEFTIGKGQQKFIVKTKSPSQNLAQYEGYLQVFISTSPQQKKIFAGKVKRKLRDGFGIEYDEDKMTYRGQFFDGLYSGWGQTLKYQGQFKEGKKNGWGKWIDQEKNIRYQGIFKDDLYHGLGYLNVSSNQVKVFMGSKKMLDSSSREEIKYAGGWVNGKFQGSGKLCTKNETYCGNFSDGLYSGEGQLTRDNKPIIGKFFKGQMI